MAEYFTLARLFEAGGVTLLLLLFCFLVALIVMIERLIYFRGKSENVGELLREVEENIHSGNGIANLELLSTRNNPAAYVLEQCLELPEERDDTLFEEVKSRAIAEKLPEMERFFIVICYG